MRRPRSSAAWLPTLPPPFSPLGRPSNERGGGAPIGSIAALAAAAAPRMLSASAWSCSSLS